MLGLGEEKNEIMQVMDDLRAAKVDFLTLGQYLQPTKSMLQLLNMLLQMNLKVTK